MSSRSFLDQLREVLTTMAALWTAFGIVLAVVGFLLYRTPLIVHSEVLEIPKMRVLSAQASELSETLSQELQQQSKSKALWERLKQTLPSESQLLIVEVNNPRNRSFHELIVKISGVSQLHDYGLESNSRAVLDATATIRLVERSSASHEIVTRPTTLPAYSFIRLAILARFLFQSPYIVTVETTETGEITAAPKTSVSGFGLFIVRNAYWFLVLAVLFGVRVVAIALDNLAKRRIFSRNNSDVGP